MPELAPLYGQIHAVAATIRTRTSSGWLHDAARHLDHLAIEVGKTIHDTAAELHDTQSLAAARLQVCQSQDANIADYRQKLDNSNRRYTALNVSASRLVDCVIERLNPPRTLAVDWPACVDAVEQIWAYVVSQPCTCDDSQLRTDAEARPCERCRVLGRVSDRQAERWNG